VTAMLVRTALLALTCAACVDAPRVVDIAARTVPDATEAIAALHVRVASLDVVRCQAFTEWPIALPADRAADGDRLTVTAVDRGGEVLPAPPPWGRPRPAGARGRGPSPPSASSPPAAARPGASSR
jgi:hypothetical protein